LLIISAAPPEKASAVSAVSETGTDMGTALGIAVTGSIGTAVYRGHASTACVAFAGLTCGDPAIESWVTTW
jgi:DHA2 family multidrug resistance protein-like MFS transporter